MWGFDGLMMLGVLVLIGLAVWAVLTATNHVPGARVMWAGDLTGRNRARQVLDQRYASGEMSTDDYTERLHTLGL